MDLVKIRKWKILKLKEKKMPRKMPKEMEAQRKKHVTPTPFSREQFIAEGRKRTGTYTASETGARHLADQGRNYREQREIMDAAKGTFEFEHIIKGRRRKR